MISSKSICLLVVFLISLQSEALSFEVDMFKSGMSRSTVKEMIKNRLIEEKDNNIIARQDDSDRFYSFTFCEDKLVQLQKHLAPSIKDFIILFDRLTTLYGKPVDSHSEVAIKKPSFEVISLSFYWKKGKETISVSYTVFPSNDSFSILYEISNKCF